MKTHLITLTVTMVMLACSGVTQAVDMEWVTISEEGFTGQMSKYETTNAQYCEFLNAAMVCGLITVYNDGVYAVSDTSHSEIYFKLYPAGSRRLWCDWSDSGCDPGKAGSRAHGGVCQLVALPGGRYFTAKSCRETPSSCWAAGIPRLGIPS